MTYCRITQSTKKTKSKFTTNTKPAALLVGGAGEDAAGAELLLKFAESLISKKEEEGTQHLLSMGTLWVIPALLGESATVLSDFPYKNAKCLTTQAGRLLHELMISNFFTMVLRFDGALEGVSSPSQKDPMTAVILEKLAEVPEWATTSHSSKDGQFEDWVNDMGKGKPCSGYKKYDPKALAKVKPVAVSLPVVSGENMEAKIKALTDLAHFMVPTVMNQEVSLKDGKLKLGFTGLGCSETNIQVLLARAENDKDCTRPDREVSDAQGLNVASSGETILSLKLPTASCQANSEQEVDVDPKDLKQLGSKMCVWVRLTFDPKVRKSDRLLGTIRSKRCASSLVMGIDEVKTAVVSIKYRQILFGRLKKQGDAFKFTPKDMKKENTKSLGYPLGFDIAKGADVKECIPYPEGQPKKVEEEGGSYWMVIALSVFVAVLLLALLGVLIWLLVTKFKQDEDEDGSAYGEEDSLVAMVDD